MANYVIIETWNGEGYSSENKAYVMSFKDNKEARHHITGLFMQQTGMVKVGSLCKKNLIVFETEDEEDAGSFAYEKVGKIPFGVIISCNINEYELVDEEDYNLKLSEVISKACKEDLDDMQVEDDNVFIGAYEEEIDYQFVKL